MPQLMEYIDKIARNKNRDVLYLIFKDTSDEPLILSIQKILNIEMK
jgi:hypothetical protein